MFARWIFDSDVLGVAITAVATTERLKKIAEVLKSYVANELRAVIFCMDRCSIFYRYRRKSYEMHAHSSVFHSVFMTFLFLQLNTIEMS